MYPKGLLIGLGQVSNLLLAIYTIFESVLTILEGEWYSGLVLPVLFVSLFLFYGELMTGLSRLLGWGLYAAQGWSIAIRLMWLKIAGLLYWISRDSSFEVAESLRPQLLWVAIFLVAINAPLLIYEWDRLGKIFHKIRRAITT
ncbi:MAG: hypothetical protein A3G05_01755 [Candidatus Zambryskibacteria bacterium RIFCSPLOWO2_12_FULL_45_14]|uniref:Uncharacterized protein n=2 Tax=Candidatus Zambryskiibacteriota TaxID=1817925 RepID=A0A1G2UMC4_9BACT|nr:MAG: hypothetical protein A3H60_00340 [Candidatus Zambryskibacteria bacterium RIFCSPLOWO2_02_FULL_44_12b]OHB14077.1 MAG: hypothetical protein A3G05_01755 [Candidatus Zambryskibacteria bacterium RIFCSPLOWO2_12_FULL_45_14]